MTYIYKGFDILIDHDKTIAGYKFSIIRNHDKWVMEDTIIEDPECVIKNISPYSLLEEAKKRIDKFYEDPKSEYKSGKTCPFCGRIME